MSTVFMEDTKWTEEENVFVKSVRITCQRNLAAFPLGAMVTKK